MLLKCELILLNCELMLLKCELMLCIKIPDQHKKVAELI